ncbi:lysophospholipid acyltransferase family protein [Clostridium thermarum]|uniref:lysophospholipid acyltransferase family protein n=1 Tax=Clostridium thermarum TaxID=1716543 RepID=UPI001FAA76D6|nr:lysophospholipid acyltransferase family protein [Clostridium thermarum]
MKLLWYSYFGVYLAGKSLSLIKIKRIMKRDPEEGRKYAFKKVQEITNYVMKLSRTKLEVYGVENIPEEACVFVSNHQAIFDAFAILCPLKNVTAFIAKKEIKKIPLVHAWLDAIGTVFIDRSNIREGMKALTEGAQNIKEGISMVIFPEGTRSLSSEMGTMKKGSLKMAFIAKAPIVPVTVDGTYRVLEVGNKVTGHTIKIMFHKPIYTTDLSKEEQKDLTDVIQDTIASGLKQMSES